MGVVSLTLLMHNVGVFDFTVRLLLHSYWGVLDSYWGDLFVPGWLLCYIIAAGGIAISLSP